jgi:hypothetical protein
MITACAKAHDADSRLSHVRVGLRRRVEKLQRRPR